MSDIQPLTSSDISLCERPQSFNDVAPNICINCNVTLEIRSDEYICPQCGRITPYLEGSFAHDSSRSPNDYRMSCSSDPLREQFDTVTATLVKRFEAYASVRGKNACPPITMAATVAQIFIEIQRNAILSGHPIARRGDVRDEILALILLSECNRARVNRTLDSDVRIRKYDITRMLGLRTDGFARGKEQLLDQAEIGNVIIDTDRDLYRQRIRALFDKSLGAYLREEFPDTAQILYHHHLRFIRKIIALSVAYGIGSHSQIQSRIIGSIWYIIRTQCYHYSAQLLERASDGIKSGTFGKFTKIIERDATLRKLTDLYFPGHSTIGKQLDSTRSVRDHRR